MKKSNETTRGIVDKKCPIIIENIFGLILLTSDPLLKGNNITLPGDLVRAYAIYKDKLYYITQNPYCIEPVEFRNNNSMNDFVKELDLELEIKNNKEGPIILIQDLHGVKWNKMLEIIKPPLTPFQREQTEVMKKKTEIIPEGVVKNKIEAYEEKIRKLDEEMKELYDKIKQSNSSIRKKIKEDSKNKKKIKDIHQKRCDNEPQLEKLTERIERLTQCIKEKEILYNRIQENIKNEDRELKHLEEGGSGSNYSPQLFSPVCSDNNTDYSTYIISNKIDKLSGLLSSPSTRQEILNFRNSDGETCLHLAVNFNKKKIVKLLVKNGANINAKDNDGFTPVDLDNKNVIKVILADKERSDQITPNSLKL